MDDDRMVLEVSSSILHKLGHAVDLARDGSEALVKYANALEAGKRYDCVIMDLTVPGGMGGSEAMTKILGIDPRARGIVSSGYAADPVMADPRSYGFAGVLPKPFTVTSLRQVLAQVLNG